MEGSKQSSETADLNETKCCVSWSVKALVFHGTLHLLISQSTGTVKPGESHENSREMFE